MKIENPLSSQLDRYKKIVAYLALLFMVIWFYMTTYYNLPELDYASLLGNSYLPYVITSTLLLSSFIGLWIFFGMFLQTWLNKKAVDTQLHKLSVGYSVDSEESDLNGILPQKEKESKED